MAWTGEEIVRLREFARTPPRRFSTKDEAIARYLKASGLIGPVPPASDIAEAGVVEYDGGWRLAATPATASVGLPPMPALLAAARCPVHLARGETDGLVTLDQLLAYDHCAESLAGGHSTMVERPEAVWQ